MRVLAVGAHPDDVEIVSAGTLLAYRSAGAETAVCVMTDGRLGAADGDSDTIADRRAEEARRSATVLDAQLYMVGEPDGFLFDDRGTRSAFVEVLRAFSPDIVLAPDPDDYHPDHRAAAAIVVNSMQLSVSPLLITTSPPLQRQPAVFYADSLALTGSPPQRWVDITAHLHTKLAALQAHASQNTWMRCTDGIDYLEFVRRQAHLRGLQCGVEAAEAFRPVHQFPINRSSSTLPGLADHPQEQPSCAE